MSNSHTYTVNDVTIADNGDNGSECKASWSFILSGVRTLTSNIVVEMGYAEGLHREALIATAVVLFVFILLINLSFSALKKKEG